MTPVEFEDKLNALEYDMVKWLTENNKIFNALLLIVFIIFLFLGRGIVSGVRIKFLNFSNITSSYTTMILLLTLSIMIPFLKTSIRLRAVITIFSIGTVFDIYNSIWKEASLGIYLSFLILALLSYLFLTSNFLKKLKFSAWIYLLLVITLTYYLFKFCNGWQWFFLKKPMFYFAFVVSYIVSNTLFSKTTYAKMVFSPAHLLLPLNYPVEEELIYAKEDYSVWASGFIQIMKAFALSCMASLVFVKINFLDASVVSIAFATYVIYLLLAPAIANFVTGTARLYMLNVPDCSNHTWLSGSPLDFLKRENVHAYKFSIRFFYFNFLKITRNPLIIVLCYILVFPLFRDSLNYFTKNDFMTWKVFYDYYSKGYAFWLLIFAAIMATFKSLIFNRVANGWRAVAATHVVMLIIFYLFTLSFRMF